MEEMIQSDGNSVEAQCDHQRAEIAALEARVDSLRSELQAAEGNLRAAKIAATGISVGDIVRSEGTLHRVTFIDARWTGKPWLRGNPQRKDGSFGTSVRHLYERWETVDRTSDAANAEVA